MIRIGSLGFRGEEPTYEGYTNIPCFSKSALYSDLSPFFLRDEQGRIMENVWQFSKVYERVPAVDAWDWKHPAEQHVVHKNQLTPAYWAWRQKGMSSSRAIRFPVGKEHRRLCLGSIAGQTRASPVDAHELLSLVDARKQIYIPQYCRLVKQTKSFQQLKTRLEQGERLLLIEYDGPKQKDLLMYQHKYGVQSSFIERSSMEATSHHLNIMLHDETHSFGHGYCLALALLDLDEQVTTWEPPRTRQLVLSCKPRKYMLRTSEEKEKEKETSSCVLKQNECSSHAFANLSSSSSSSSDVCTPSSSVSEARVSGNSSL